MKRAGTSASGSRNALLALPVITCTALSLVVASAPDADARHRPPGPHFSIASPLFADGFTPPRAFSCRYVEKRNGKIVDDYACSAPGGPSFMLGQVLQTGLEKPGNGWDGISAPDAMQCGKKKEAPPVTDNYRCMYKHRHGNRPKHCHKFTLRNMVAVQHSGSIPDREVDWYAPHHRADEVPCN
ncbi:hypothetical protein [Streptomyces poonensis]|nr:hypothetical protein [Streptomyces poonensis]